MGDEYASGMWPEDSEGDALAYGLGWDSVHMFPFSQKSGPTGHGQSCPRESACFPAP